MALSTRFGREIPEGAIAITEAEALDHQKKIVRDWPSDIDVISLKYGSEIAGATSFVSSTIILDYFRRAVNVRKRSFTFILSPIMFAPAYLSGVFCQRFITDETLLMRLKCPLCRQLKFTLSQSYFGLVFPALFGIGTFTLISTYTKSYSFESVHTDPKAFWMEMFKIAKGGGTTFKIAGLLQSVVVLSLPYVQAKQLDNVLGKIREFDDNELLES